MLDSIYVPTPTPPSLKKETLVEAWSKPELQSQISKPTVTPGQLSWTTPSMDFQQPHFIGAGGSDVPGFPSIMVQEADGRDQASRSTLLQAQAHRTGVASLFNYSGVWSVGCGAAFQQQTQVTDESLLSLPLSFVERQVWLEVYEPQPIAPCPLKGHHLLVYARPFFRSGL